MLRIVYAVRLVAAVMAVGLLVAACGSSSSKSSSSSTGSGSSSPSSSGGASSGVAHAKAAVAKYTGPAGVPTAGPAITGGISSLKGKKVEWIADATQIPYFAAVVQGAQAAASAAGIKLQVCNGNNTPSAMSACIDDAVSEGAAGVVGDGFNIGQVQQAVNSLKSHHIPYVQGDLTQQPGNDQIAYVWNNSFEQSRLAADALIADSKGKANILVIRHTDSPSTEGFMDQGGMPELKTYCPGCTETVINANDANLQQLTPAVSAALEKNPDINYIFAEFDLDVSSVTSALQSRNKKIPIYSTTGQLSSLQLIKSGHYQVADGGTDPAYMGWAGIDQVLRMMRGQKPNTTVPMPLRLFTSSNIGSVSLTNSAFADGSWYGATGFQNMFRKLWGV